MKRWMWIQEVLLGLSVVACFPFGLYMGDTQMGKIGYAFLGLFVFYLVVQTVLFTINKTLEWIFPSFGPRFAETHEAYFKDRGDSLF